MLPILKIRKFLNLINVIFMQKRYDHLTAESQAQQKWETELTTARENNPGPLYSIDTPPPTVSGNLHIGHIFSYTQTDIVARYKRMCGYSVFYPFGFDDNGLPTERYVEQQKDIKAHQLPRGEFIELCLETTHAVEQEFKKLWQRMGLSVDWRAEYSTISASTRKLSQESFIELYKKGFIFRRDEPALYCTFCRTSVAQAELDDKEEASTFNDLIFFDANGNDLVISTTRPELLPSCVALLYNPADPRYMHLQGTQATVPIFNYSVPVYADESVQIDKGSGLVMCCTFGDTTDVAWYKKFNLPYKQSIGFDGKFVPGTGILEGLKVTDARARIIEELKKDNLLLQQRPITHTVSVHERCKKNIEFVVLKQWFVNILDHKQQFLDIADQINWYPAFMKSRYINWVENLSWNWCISRQRFFGIPFPVWHCSDCGEVILADKKDLPVDPMINKPNACPKCKSTNIVPDTDVMDTWNTSSITPYICYQLFDPSANVFAPNITEFMPMSMRPQAHDIIRTWAFDTIVKSWMHHGIAPWKDIIISGHVLSDKKEKLSKSKEHKALSPENLLAQYPADVIRYWTASGSLGQDVAFSENQLKIGLRLVTKLWNAFLFSSEHITLRAPQGERSEENHTQEKNPEFFAVRPEMLEGKTISSVRPEVLEGKTISSVRPEALEGPTKLGTINSWLLHECTKTFESYENYFAKNEFGLALLQVEQFFWNSYCDNYIELTKNQLFNPNEYKKEEVQATLWTLHQVGLRILQMYAPYLPHITEAIYGELYNITSVRPELIEGQNGKSGSPSILPSSQGYAETRRDERIGSIHQTKFEAVQKPYEFPEEAALATNIITVVSAVRKLKTEKQLSLKVELAALTIFGRDAKLVKALQDHEQLIRGVTQAKEIRYEVGILPAGELVDIDGAWHGKV
jgi:valyl-tRNA synthetase